MSMIKRIEKKDKDTSKGEKPKSFLEILISLFFVKRITKK